MSIRACLQNQKLITKDAAPDNKQHHQTHTFLLPELVLVYFYDLPLQFEGLFREQLEVSDVV